MPMSTVAHADTLIRQALVFDGTGQSPNLQGFQRPDTFPDFTDCPTATPEPEVQWRAIVTNGGPARAFSEIMPSFKDQLTPDQINKVVAYLRHFCADDDKWPRGDLNLPRAMITEKVIRLSRWGQTPRPVPRIEISMRGV